MVKRSMFYSPNVRALIHVSQLHSYIRQELMLNCNAFTLEKSKGWLLVEAITGLDVMPKAISERAIFIYDDTMADFSGITRKNKHNIELNVYESLFPNVSVRTLKSAYTRGSYEVHGRELVRRKWEDRVCPTFNSAAKTVLEKYGFTTLGEAVGYVVGSYGDVVNLIHRDATFNTDDGRVAKIIEMNANVAGEGYNIIAIARNPDGLEGGDFVEWYKSTDISDGMLRNDSGTKGLNMVLGTYGAEWPNE